MATIIKLLFIILILWWVGRFFSATLNRLWLGTVGAAIHWVTHNGSLMMRIVAIAALLLGVLIIFQWQ